MPVKDNREYRSLASFEAVESDDDYIVEGYATTFDVPYEMFGGYKECIRSNAFDDCDMSDVIFQYDHEGLVMARQSNGSLGITLDSHGMHVRASLKGTRKGRELHEAIKCGLVNRMSWGFLVAPDGWEYDSKNRIAYITKVSKVFDVSAVSIPANQDTEIKARSYFNGVIELERQRESLQRKKQEDMEERQRIAAILSAIRPLGV